MKKLVYLLVVALPIHFLMGCMKETPSTFQQSPEVTANAKPTGLQQVSLTVVMEPSYTTTEDQLASSKINSDNGSAYVNGTDYVRAIIDPNGNFSFSTNTSKNSLAKRFVVYDLSDPVDPSSTSPGFGRGYYFQYNYLFSTSASTFGTTPFIPLQNLEVGTSECLAFTGNINGDGVNSVFKYTVRFHSTKDDLAASPTAFAVVKRLSDAQWRITPGQCGTSADNNVGALWTGDTRNEIWKGNYHLPFSFILTKI